MRAFTHAATSDITDVTDNLEQMAAHYHLRFVVVAPGAQTNDDIVAFAALDGKTYSVHGRDKFLDQFHAMRTQADAILYRAHSMPQQRADRSLLLTAVELNNDHRQSKRNALALIAPFLDHEEKNQMRRQRVRHPHRSDDGHAIRGYAA